MGVTLDSGAIGALQESLKSQAHPLAKHLKQWIIADTKIAAPSVAWAEYWRARDSNHHFIAKIRERILIEPVSQYIAESAAEALRKWPHNDSRNSVKHLIDAIVMAHANEAGDAVYTSDADDFARLWDHFNFVKALVSASTGEIIRKR